LVLFIWNAYDVDEWYILTQYEFYDDLPLYFARMNNGDKIYEILLTDENVRRTLYDELTERITDLFIVEKSDQDYIKLIKVFKVVMDKLYEYQKNFVPYYIKDYKDLEDQDMVDWLINFYREREGEDPRYID